MSEQQVAEDKRRAAAERRERELQQKRANMARAREVKAKRRRQKATAPPKEEIPLPRIRVSPTGRVNRPDAALVLGRDVHTLENWASRKIGPSYILVGGRAFYQLQELLDWRGFAAEPGARTQQQQAGELPAE
jgi:hypothetical protein